MSPEKPENAPTPDPQAVADSLAAAAGITGYPVILLEKMKECGCPAFRGSRVYIDDLEAWISDHPEVEQWEKDLAEVDRLEVEIRRERLRKIRFQNDVEQGNYIAKSLLAPALIQLGNEQKAVLRSLLEETLPERIEGKSAADCRISLRAVVDELCARFHAGTKHWTN